MINKINTKNLGANIAAGSGYSSDSQQIAPQACFNVASSPASGQQSYAQLGAAMYFSDIQNSLKIDVSTKGGVGMFSASAEASYMRSMEDKDYSLSLNYFTYALETVSVNLAGYGLQALNSFGQEAYNNGNNPYFGLLCGDNYLTSFDQGAMLIMGINIEFDSHQAKQQFSAAASGGFGDIFSASASISKIASQYNLQGSVSMQAYQIGGNPAELSNILSKSSNGDYYALSCDINNINNCQMAASGMLDYAKYNFTTQISFANNKGLTPLGLGYVEYLPIDYLGLHTQSLVNQTVKDDRLQLAEALIENQYYVQKFHELVETYPVEWDTTSSIYQTSQNLYQQAQNNVNSIMSPNNPDQGALGCFDTPDQCNSITQNIQASLVPINGSDLGYLSQVMYYYDVPTRTGNFIYPNGDSNNSWSFFASNPNSNLVQQIDYCLITPAIYNFHYLETTNPPHDTISDWYTYNGTSADGGLTYSGSYIDNTENRQWGSAPADRYDNPFYFEAYNGTDPTISIVGEEAGGLHDLHA